MEGDGWSYTGLFLLTVMVPAMLVSIFLFWRQRAERHIAARVPFLSMACCLAILVPNTGWSYVLLYAPGVGWRGVPCFVNRPPMMAALMLAVLAIFLRATVLVFLFEIARDVAAAQRAAKENAAALLRFKPSFYTRNRRFVEPQALRRIFLAALAVLATMFFISLAWAHPPEECSPKTYTFEDIWFLSGMAVVPVLTVGIAVMAVKLRKHGPDAFGIRREFQLIVGVLAVTIVLALPGFTTAYSPDRVIALRYTMVIAQFGTCAVALVQCLYPLLLVRGYEKRLRRLAERLAKAESVEELLKTPEGFQAFLRFAQSEFTSELVLCWERLQHFKQRDPGSFSSTATAAAAAAAAFSLPSPTPTSPAPARRAALQNYQKQQQQLKYLPLPEAAATATTAVEPLPSSFPGDGAAIVLDVHQEQAVLGPGFLASLLDEAEAIQGLFLRSGASLEVNLSATMRAEVTNHLATLRARVEALTAASAVTGTAAAAGNTVELQQLAREIQGAFAPVEKELVQLMQTNSFHRFRASPYARGILSGLSSGTTPGSPAPSIRSAGGGGTQKGPSVVDAMSGYGPAGFDLASPPAQPRLAFVAPPPSSPPPPPSSAAASSAASTATVSSFQQQQQQQEQY